MIQSIGECAGEVWSLLESKGPLSANAISENLKKNPMQVYMALGWLAREDKIAFNNVKRGTSISLR